MAGAGAKRHTGAWTHFGLAGEAAPCLAQSPPPLPVPVILCFVAVPMAVAVLRVDEILAVGTAEAIILSGGGQRRLLRSSRGLCRPRVSGRRGRTAGSRGEALAASPAGLAAAVAAAAIVAAAAAAPAFPVLPPSWLQGAAQVGGPGVVGPAADGLPLGAGRVEHPQHLDAAAQSGQVVAAVAVQRELLKAAQVAHHAWWDRAGDRRGRDVGEGKGVPAARPREGWLCAA